MILALLKAGAARYAGPIFKALRSPVGLAALALVVGAYGGCAHKQREWDAAVASAQAKQATQAVKTVTQQRTETAKVETVYVDKLVEVPRITADLLSRCVGVRHVVGAGGRARMSESTGVADAPGGTDAATRQFCEELAASFAAGLRNSARLDGCTGWVCANGGCKD